jgi:hypothetical protein
MKRCSLYILVMFFLVSGVNTFAQWKYDRAIKFPTEDATYLQPFLCTIDNSGKLYVVSSRATNGNAHDILYVLANSTDTVLTKVIDYTATFDTINVKQLVGITHLNNDILVTAKINNYVVPGGSSCAYLYTDGDAAKGVRYGYNPYLSGWGTYVYGICATKDSVVIAGTPYTNGIRAYNFTSSTKFAAYGAYISPDNSNAEPGGANTSGYDVIRDVATIPNGNYFDATVPFYTSRNSKTSGELNGGIAAWTGGTQYNPATMTSNTANYTALRISDSDDFLKFNSAIVCGITCDNSGNLWVAGIDSTRRWVKSFTVDLVTGIATNNDELPSSGKSIDPDASGAPMVAPSDVAFTSDGKSGYVVDSRAKSIFLFSNGAVGVKDKPAQVESFGLKQNYPNPFNPTTMISYSLPQNMLARVSVSNILGQEVAVLVDGMMSAGSHSVSFDGSKLTSGIYFYHLQAGSSSLTKKMMLIK